MREPTHRLISSDGNNRDGFFEKSALRGATNDILMESHLVDASSAFLCLKYAAFISVQDVAEERPVEVVSSRLVQTLNLVLGIALCRNAAEAKGGWFECICANPVNNITMAGARTHGVLVCVGWKSTHGRRNSSVGLG